MMYIANAINTTDAIIPIVSEDLRLSEMLVSFLLYRDMFCFDTVFDKANHSFHSLIVILDLL